MAHKTIALTTELREQLARAQGGFSNRLKIDTLLRAARDLQQIESCEVVQHAQPPWPNGQGVGLLIRR